MLSQENINRILQIGVSLSAERNLDDLLEEILSGVMELAHCDAGTLYLLKDDALHFEIMKSGMLSNMGNLAGDSAKKGTGQLETNGSKKSSGDGGKADAKPNLPPVPLKRENVCAFSLLENRTVRVADVRQCEEYDFSGPIRYDAMTGYHTQSMLVVPMSNREGERLGVIQLINAQDGNGNVCPFPEDMTLVLESVASQAAITIQNVRYIQEIKDLVYSFVRTMSSAIDRRSPYTGNHTRHMATYCERFLDFLNDWAEENREGKEIRGDAAAMPDDAREGEGSVLTEGARSEAMFFTPERREELLMSVWLHDIGKLVIPLEVMDKPTRLLPEQHKDFLHRMEVIRLQSRIKHLEGGMSMETYEEIQTATREAQCLVEEINTGRPLADGEKEAVEALAERTYMDKDGERPWLEPEEKAMLLIPRGTLSEAERKVIESHVSATGELLSEIRFSKELSHVRECASSHHELLNGRGYPRHLQGDEIPLEVRILTILDIFDALTAADRPYKKAKTPEVALDILKADAKNGRLDEELVRLFEESRCWDMAENL